MAGIADKLNVALPDGHLMSHIVPFLEKTGIGFEGYTETDLNRRPRFMPLSPDAQKIFTQPERVYAKVIRPQDMPTHLASGNFDLAITGTDWLTEHKLRFPTSPLSEPLLKLGLSKVRIVAAVHEKDYRETLSEFTAAFRKNNKKRYLKIASEYVHLADYFAQKNNFHPYRIIMTYGATESLIPEDCHLIVENTETGTTLQQNRLKIIDELMESEGCLVASGEGMEISWKKDLIAGFAELFGNYLALLKK